MGHNRAENANSSTTSNGSSERAANREPISMNVIRYESEKLSVKRINPFIVLAIVIFVLTTMYFLLQRFGRWMYIPLVIGLIVVFSVWYIWFRRTTDRVLPAYDGPLSHFPEARLHAIGTKRELGLLATLENVPFEPMIVQQMYGRAFYYVAPGFAVILFFAMIIWIPIDTLLMRSFGATLGPQSIVVAWAIQRILPTYYRIVPGRLDIMRFSWLTDRGRVLSVWDLRKGNVTVDFQKGKVLYIEGEKKDSIWLHGIAEPYELAKAVMQGAVSTSTPAPLPSDRLLN